MITNLLRSLVKPGYLGARNALHAKCRTVMAESPRQYDGGGTVRWCGKFCLGDVDKARKEASPDALCPRHLVQPAKAGTIGAAFTAVAEPAITTATGLVAANIPSITDVIASTTALNAEMTELQTQGGIQALNSVFGAIASGVGAAISAVGTVAETVGGGFVNAVENLFGDGDSPDNASRPIANPLIIQILPAPATRSPGRTAMALVSTIR